MPSTPNRIHSPFLHVTKGAQACSITGPLPLKKDV